MKIVDGYLSRLMQVLWPDAIVYKDLIEDGPDMYYWFERAEAEPIGLGTNFKEAKESIHALTMANLKGARHGKSKG